MRTRHDETFYAEIGDVAWEEKSDEEVFTAAELAKADLLRIGLGSRGIAGAGGFLLFQSPI